MNSARSVAQARANVAYIVPSVLFPCPTVPRPLSVPEKQQRHTACAVTSCGTSVLLTKPVGISRAIFGKSKDRCLKVCPNQDSLATRTQELSRSYAGASAHKLKSGPK